MKSAIFFAIALQSALGLATAPVPLRGGAFTTFRAGEFTPSGIAPSYNLKTRPIQWIIGAPFNETNAGEQYFVYTFQNPFNRRGPYILEINDAARTPDDFSTSLLYLPARCICLVGTSCSCDFNVTPEFIAILQSQIDLNVKERTIARFPQLSIEDGPDHVVFNGTEGPLSTTPHDNTPSGKVIAAVKSFVGRHFGL